MAAERRSVFVAPHYDDVALSCGGTVAAGVENGDRALIVTVFGGAPAAPLSQFALDMHRRWGVGAADALEQRRLEECCAAKELQAETTWLELPDAIYRGERYTSDQQLFGAIHPAERDLPSDLHAVLSRMLDDRGIAAERFYVPLAVGDHVDHQHVLELGRLLAAQGHEVLAYEDFPYAGDPGGLDRLQQRIAAIGSDHAITRVLTTQHLGRRIAAIRCYESQLPVIFRRQGDPAEATERWALLRGYGRLAERFWQLPLAGG